jgi:CubicO group peptidase (beta-lactamase class C family)
MFFPFLFSLATPSPVPTADLAQDLEHWVPAYLEDKRIPGAVIGMARQSQLLVRKAFGLRDVSQRKPMSPEALFQVGSITKPVTAAIVGLLVSEGKLDWEDDLGKHLEASERLPEWVQEVTLQQLLTHTSGLPRNPANRRNLPDSPGVMLPYSTQELYAGLPAEPPTAGDWHYSNLGYALLGEVLRRASGKPYPELLEERLLQPLGMTRSGVHLPVKHEAQLAACYWTSDEEWVERPRWRMGEVCSFAGLYSNVDDLMRFAAAQYDSDSDALLKADLRGQLHAAQVTVDATQGRSMARGWFVQQAPGMGRILGHGGEVDGHSACVAVLLDSKMAIVVLTNRGGDSAEGLLQAVLSRALPSLMGS